MQRKLKKKPEALKVEVKKLKLFRENPDKAFREELAKAAGPDVDVRYCTGHSFVRNQNDEKLTDENGKFLTKPCEHFAMKGTTVCLTHGGKLPQVRAKAEQTLLEYRNRAAQRLVELAEQNAHLPTALGATIAALKQQKVIVEHGVNAGAESTRPIIKIGVIFGGMQAPKVVGVLTDGAQDAEIIEG